MARLVNTNPLGDIDLPLIGRTLAAGEEFEVPDEVAGRAPSTTTVEGAEVIDLGYGLLAQVGNYAPAQPTKGKPATAQEG